MKDKLTDSVCRTAKPRTARFNLTDGAGLYLMVKPSGARLWQMAYRFEGKQKTYSIGAYPAVSLADARSRCDAARGLLRNGVDPLPAKQQTEQVTPKTFKDAADDWRRLINKKPRAQKTVDRDERMTRYLTRAFGDKAMIDVEAKDLIDVLDTFEDDGSYETRVRLQSTALNIAGYAQGKAWIKQNPFLGIAYNKAFTAPSNVPRPAIIDAEPFGQLLRDVATYPGRQDNLVRKALELLALTFVRPGTVCAAEWAEFDLDGGLWSIPFNKLKQRKFREGIKELNGKPHLVPLARQTVAFLRELKQETGDSQFLFPGRKGRSITPNGLQVALNSIGYQGRHCPHGFRSSASTLLNAERITVEGIELPRFAEQAIEFQLEHVNASVAAIYNRDQRLTERTRMMQHWADRVYALRANRKEKPTLRIVV